MQHIRQSQVTQEFTRTEPEIVLLLGTENQPYLADVRLAFWLDSTFPTSYLQTSEVSDLRLYYNSADVTAKVAKALVNALDKSADARAQYKEAVRRWMLIFEREAPTVGLSLDMVAKQRALAAKLPDRPWSSFFGKLATTGCGYRGSLHPLHFLFREIRLPPLSLRRVLHPDAKTEERPLNQLADPRLVLSHGPSRLYAAAWAPVDLQYQGIATIAVAAVFDDAWELEMRERMLRIASRLAEVSDQVVELQRRYLDFEKRAAEFKAISDGIDASLEELLTCKGPALKDPS